MLNAHCSFIRDKKMKYVGSQCQPTKWSQCHIEINKFSKLFENFVIHRDDGIYLAIYSKPAATLRHKHRFDDVNTVSAEFKMLQFAMSEPLRSNWHWMWRPLRSNKTKTHRIGIGIQTRNVLLAFGFRYLRQFHPLSLCADVCRNFHFFCFPSISEWVSWCEVLVCGKRRRTQNEVSRNRITPHQCWTHKMEFYFVLFAPDVISANCESCRGIERTTNALHCLWALQIRQTFPPNIGWRFFFSFFSWIVWIVSYNVWPNVHSLHGLDPHTTPILLKCHSVYSCHSDKFLSTLDHQTLDYMHSRVKMVLGISSSWKRPCHSVFVAIVGRQPLETWWHFYDFCIVRVKCTGALD